jgi:hypothetical protein
MGGISLAISPAAGGSTAGSVFKSSRVLDGMTIGGGSILCRSLLESIRKRFAPKREFQLAPSGLYLPDRSLAI